MCDTIKFKIQDLWIDLLLLLMELPAYLKKRDNRFFVKSKMIEKKIKRVIFGKLKSINWV